MMPLYTAIGTLVVLLFIVIVWNIRTEKRLRKLFRGTKAISIENILTNALKTIEEHGSRLEAEESHGKVLSGQISQCLRNIVVKRYSAFNDGTAQNSFTLALVNDRGDGVILSSLYARERMSIYAKNIIAGKSQTELTDEEKVALAEALTKKTV
jgi:hypothetical protein